MRSRILLFTIIVSSSLSTVSCKRKDDCPETFEGRCTCGVQSQYPNADHQPRYVVNCTNSNFNEASMLEDLPEETEVLIFTGNNLKELSDNIFGLDFPHDKLRYIDMSNNHITFVLGRTFHKVKNVETLILNYNEMQITYDRERPRIFSNFENLKHLHLTDAFSDDYNATHYYLLKLEDIFIESFLSKIERLHLEQNEIWFIGTNETIFCPLESLQHLYLADNKLSDMDFAIDCLKELTYIDLRFNMINKLSDDAMARLDGFEEKHKRALTLDLKDNPFFCDCRASHFLHWVKNAKTELREVDDYRCLDGFPRENIHTKILEVDHVTCPETAAGQGSGYSSGTVAFLSFLIVFLTLLIVGITCYHKHKLTAVVRPLIKDITNRIGYSGLAHEEPMQEVHV